MANPLRLHKGRISLIPQYIASIRGGGEAQRLFQKTILASTDSVIVKANLSWRIGEIVPSRGCSRFDWGLAIEDVKEMLFLLAILAIICLLMYCKCRGVDTDGFFDSVSHGESRRTKKLYCETCRRNCDIDDSGWCHECERITPFHLFAEFVDYVANTKPYPNH